MRVLVCGSRNWDDAWPINAILDGLLSAYEDRFTVIDGAAAGADELAHQWAHYWYVDGERYPANWGLHGKAAGPIRNKRMLDEGKPDLVVAFSEQPITSGTANMVKQAKAAGIPVWVIGHG